ncbi:MAG: ribosome biogenesis GTPase YlqF [Byssovorax sp.]
MLIQWYPGHMTKARREMAAAMPSQDVIIEVLDARMPRASSNPVVTELRADRPCIKVLSKSDIADPAITEAWLRHFEAAGAAAEAEAERRGGAVLAIALRTDQPGEARAKIAELSRRLVQRSSSAGKAVRAMIVGVPNVGKSTLINTLMNRVVATVGDKPAVTKAQQQVVLKSGMVLWDSPGLMWPKLEDEAGSMRLALAGSIPDTAIDYLNVAMFGAQLFLERYPERLLARFKLAELPPTPEALIAEIGRRRGCLRSGGTIDLHKAAEILVHEFRSGGLGRISLESPSDIPIAVESEGEGEGEHEGWSRS